MGLDYHDRFFDPWVDGVNLTLTQQIQSHLESSENKVLRKIPLPPILKEQTLFKSTFNSINQGG
jgi:hypothetical protein